MNAIDNVKNALTKAKTVLVKHSPTIFLAAGITGVVAGAVVACVSTTKVSKIIEERNSNIKTVEEVYNNGDNNDNYSLDDAKKDILIIKTKSVIKMIGLYSPAIALELGGIAAILASHGIMKKRNSALAAAYATVDTSYKKLKKLIEEKHENAESADNDIPDNPNAEVKEEPTKKDSLTDFSPYAFVYDECTSAEYESDDEYNEYFLRAKQSLFSQMLKSKGYLCLNEVLDSIGIDGLPMGQVVGWVYRENNPGGDNYVDFGIKRMKASDGTTKIILDFNVQGNILDLM